MSYIFFSDEEKQRANDADIASFLISKGEALKRSGKEYTWESPTGKVSIRGNEWYSQYERVGGGAIKFVQKFYGLSYPEAVRELLGSNAGTIVQKNKKEKKQVELIIPEKNKDMRRVYGYLCNERFIDKEIINAFVKSGLIYEDAKYHNVVFVGKDESGVVRHIQKRTTSHRSDFKGNVEGSDAEVTFGSAQDYTEEFTYDEYGRLVTKYSSVSGTHQYNYKDAFETTPNSTRVDDIKTYFKQDCLGRNTGKEIVICDDTAGSEEKLLSEQITYLKHGDHATNIPLTISYGSKTTNGFVVKGNIKYKYDEMGNIHEVYENGEFVAEYKYDSIGRLVRENNKKLGKTYVFTYDNKGNILTRTEYSFTLKPDDFVKETDGEVFEYTYANDKLVSYNDELFEYDVIGNPTVYRGNALTWRFGRRLTTFGDNSFNYDAEGKRILKNDITFTYDSDGRLIKQSDGIEFINDGKNIIGIEYGSNRFFYRRDLLGNVIALLDISGNIVVKYTYDAWGNHKVLNASGVENTSVYFIGNINPIRYRGYYYDVETGLYYLQSRYYDPQTGRFINIDDISYLDPENINGLNLFAYCSDNPVMYVDPTGHSAILIGLIVGAIIGASVGFGMAAYVDYVDDGVVFNGSVAWYDYLGAMVVGGILGGAIGAGIGYIAPAIPSIISSIGTFLSSIGSSVSSFMGTSFTYGFALSNGGTIAISVTGAQILGIASALLGGIIMFSKGSGPRMGHNQHEKQMWNEAMRQLDIKDKDLIRRLHQANEKYPYAEKLKDLLANLRDILSKINGG